MFQVVAFAPDEERIRIGLWQPQLEYALEDRDELRAAYLRKGSDWRVEVEDTDGRTMEWPDAEAA